jgi:hypothetical protein
MFHMQMAVWEPIVAERNSGRVDNEGGLLGRSVPGCDLGALRARLISAENCQLA